MSDAERDKILARRRKMVEDIRREVANYRRNLEGKRAMSWDEDRMNEELDDLGPEPPKNSAKLWGLLFDLVTFAAAMAAILVTLAMVSADQEISVKPGRLKKITTTLDGKKILWRAVGDFDIIEDSSGKYVTTLFPTPGKYAILVITAKADEPLTELITITVEGKAPPGPGPDPKPPPDPDPKPNPTGKIKHIIVVEETGDGLAARGKFFNDNALWTHTTSSGYRKTIIDKDVKDPTGQTPPNLVSYISEAKAKGLPYVFLVEENGVVLHRGQMTWDPIAFLALLKKVGGP